MRLMADNDVIGQVALFRRILESDEWREYATYYQVRFIGFKDLDLTSRAPDPKVWQACQDAGAILITGNRAGGNHSLDETIERYSQSDSLPVITVARPRRVFLSPSYANECVFQLLDYIERIESLRGTGRLYIPSQVQRRA